jgi:hypothetical protein
VRSPRFAAVVTLASLVLAGCGSGTANGVVYGPPGHRFSIAFPSTPKSEADTEEILESLPLGSKVYLYAVSNAANIFANSSPTPRPPTYAVGVFLLASATSATEYVAYFADQPGVRRVTIDGKAGVEFVGPETSSVYRRQRATDPTASEGTLLVARGKTVFTILTITTSANTARAFLSSFRTA